MNAKNVYTEEFEFEKIAYFVLGEENTFFSNFV